MPAGRKIIAVDGPAGSGKSSVSREVARLLGIKYIDSGALYRAITYFVLDRHGAVERGRDYSGEIARQSLRQVFHPDGTSSTYLNGADVSEKIRTEEIARHIGIISDDPAVREIVNAHLREWSREDSIVMDGRDIGTVVFPDADLKIYLDASVEVRALRRSEEYKEKGKTVDVNDIKKQIILRDQEDKSRPVGRLARADDAVYVDTSRMTKEEVVRKIAGLASGQSSF